jgi:hypothetical protein
VKSNKWSRFSRSWSFLPEPAIVLPWPGRQKPSYITDCAPVNWPFVIEDCELQTALLNKQHITVTSSDVSGWDRVVGKSASHTVLLLRRSLSAEIGCLSLSEGDCFCAVGNEALPQSFAVSCPASQTHATEHLVLQFLLLQCNMLRYSNRNWGTACSAVRVCNNRYSIAHAQ